MSTLDETAISIHELFSAYVRAGFSEEQAMRLIEAHIAATEHRS